MSAGATVNKEYNLEEYESQTGIVPFSIGKYAMIPTMDPNFISRTEIIKIATNEYSCRECGDRAARIALALCPVGDTLKPILGVNHKTKLPYQSVLYEETAKIAREFIKEEGVRRLHWHVAHANLLYGSEPRKGSSPDYKATHIDEGGFPHFHYKVSNPVGPRDCSGEMKCYEPIREQEYERHNRIQGDARNEYERIEMVMNKYVVLFWQLFEKMGMDQDLHASAKLLLELCGRARYGENMVSALEWFLEAIERSLTCGKRWTSLSLRAKLWVIGNTIATSTFQPADEDEGGYVITIFHVVNNNIESLLSKGLSEEGVIKMVEDRNNPTKYQQSSAPPSVTAVNKASRLLEGQRNRIFTQEEVALLPGCVVVGSGKLADSTSSIFAQMRLSAQVRNREPNRHSGFASRVQKISPKVPSTLSELHAMVQKGDIWKLELELDNCQMTMIADTTLPREDMGYVGNLPQPHFWAYSSRRYMERGLWQECSQIYACITSRRVNFFFLFKDEAFSRRLYNDGYVPKNCWFEEFFAPKHYAAKKAIKEFNTLDTADFPAQGNPAVGCGKSVNITGLVDTTSSAFTLRINGTTIVKLKPTPKETMKTMPSPEEFRRANYSFL